MKILYLLDGMGLCGGNRIIFEQANRLTDLGHKVHLIPISGYFDGWFPLRAKVINKISNTNYYDIVIATYFSTYFTMMEKFKNVNKFYLIQGKESLFDEDINSVRNRSAKLTYKKHDGVTKIAIAKHLVKWLKTEYGVDSNYLPNGVDLNFFKPSIILPKSKPIILIEGNISFWLKGIGDALHAIKILRRTHNLELWHLTSDDDVLHGVDKRFKKPEQSLIPQLYSTADIVLKPSIHEGSPLPVMESMACGGFTVISDCDGCLEHGIDHYNCRVFKAGDVNDMVKILKDVLDSGESYKQEIRYNSRQYAINNFEWNPIIEKLNNYLIYGS